MYKYELRTDNEKKEYLFCESNLTREQIKKLVVAKIRQKYSINDEMKLQRCGILDLQNVEFATYNKYVENCRIYGNELKSQALIDKKKWENYQLENNDYENYIKKLKEAGLI